MRYVMFTKKARENGTESVKPADWAFMEQSGKVLAAMPETWKKYPPTTEGMMGIIEMEMGELKKAGNDTDRSHELVHLASAALRMWRYLNHVEL